MSPILQNGLLQLFSLLFMTFTVTFILALNESDDWKNIRSATLRRWSKLILAILAIAVGVNILGS